MGSLKQANKLFCPLRKCFVVATPEEQVRQRWICELTRNWGFPHLLLAVEKPLSALTQKAVPNRRIDLVAFAKNEKGSLFPLLLMECKACDLTTAFANQVLSYNAFIGAPFVALANDRQMMLGSYSREEKMFTFIEGLKRYEELKQAVQTDACPQEEGQSTPQAHA